MVEKKDVLFEVKAIGGSDKVLVWAERKLNQVRIYANDKERGEVDLGRIDDIWRENDNAQAELQHLRGVLNLPKDGDIAVTIGAIITKIDEITKLMKGKRPKK